MRYRFPYEWADTLDTEALSPCSVYEAPRAAACAAADLRACLEAPILAPPLAAMLREAKARRVLILADDLTRPTPQREMLPPLLERLKQAGICEEDITLLVATGLHRGMNGREIEERFGGRVAGKVRVVNHDAYNKESQILLGRAEDGTPIRVNRLAVEHDFIIAVGCIEPHRIGGFSGGAKMVQPGICGEEITASLHWHGWLEEGEALYGVVDNPIRREMEGLGEKAGLRFIVNVVLDADGRPRRYFAGDPRKAFRAGCAQARSLCSVAVRRADIVVVDSHPFDLDLWQACKAVSVAELVVRRGGTIILVTPCPEGLSRHGPQIRRSGYLPKSEILKRVGEGSLKDLSIACHLMALGRILARGELLIVSAGLEADLLQEVGLRSAPGVAEAIRMARARLGREAEIGILKQGCTLIPAAA